MALLEISQAPYISSVDQDQQMQTSESLSVPIQIRCQQETFLPRGFLAWISKQNVLLLFSPFEDIENPIQPSFIAHALHVRPYMLLVDGWRLGDHAKGLWGVLLDVLVCAGIDEIELEIGRSIFRCAGGC